METITLYIECEHSVAESLASDFRPHSVGEIIVAEKNNLDGTTGTILEIIQVIASLAGTITPILISYLDRKKVKRVKFENFEIENPTSEQWEKIWESYLSSRKAL